MTAGILVAICVVAAAIEGPRRISWALAVLIMGASAHAGELTITIRDVRSDKGQVSVGLYREGGAWPDGLPIRQADVPAQTGVVTLHFDDVPPGRYAMSGFHDENANGVFDKTWIGLPKEGFIFSRDAKPVVASPEFSACAIDIGDAPAEITARVQYWRSTR